MKIKRLEYKWELIVMLWLAFFLNQGDRQVYGAIVGDIERGVGISSTQAGLVVTVFTVVYGCLAPFAGYIGDFLRRKWIVICSLIVFSLGTLLTGFAGQMGTVMGALIFLIVTRGIATGAGEAFYNPAAISLITQHHDKTRATAISMHQTALYIGVIVSAIVAPLISKLYGWQSAFYLFGVFGLIVAAYCIVRMKDTPQLEGEKTERVPLLKVIVGIFSKKTIWLLAFAFGCQVFVNIGVTTWASKFFNLKFFGGADLTMASSIAMLTSCGFAIFGVLLGGRLSDVMAQKNKLARMRTGYIGLLGGAPFLVLVGFAPNLLVASIGMSLYGIFRGIYDSNLYPAMFDVIDPKLRASSVGVLTAFAFLVGCLAPVYLGAVQGDGKSIEPFSWGIASMGLFFLIGGLLIWAAAKFTFLKERYEE